MHENWSRYKIAPRFYITFAAGGLKKEIPIRSSYGRGQREIISNCGFGIADFGFKGKKLGDRSQNSGERGWDCGFGIADCGFKGKKLGDRSQNSGERGWDFGFGIADCGFKGE